MKVKELIKILSVLEQDAIVDIATDEEGNSFGDISPHFAEGEMINGRKVYSFYPENQQVAEERYIN